METILTTNRKRMISKILIYLMLIIFTLSSLYPLFFTINSSFKTSMEIFKNPFSLPTSLSFENYIRAWNVANIGRYLKNSFILSISTSAIVIFFGSLASFGISKFDFKLKNFVFVFFLTGLMIPVQSVIIPLTFNLGKLGIYDNLFMVIMMMAVFQLPMSILLYTGVINGIPDSLVEASVIDGCGPLRTYISVIVPLAKSATVTILILTFLSSWNNVLFPLVFLNKESVRPVSVGILSFVGQYVTDYGGIIASIVLTFLPPLLVYIFAQETIQKGFADGAVKG